MYTEIENNDIREMQYFYILLV